MVGAPGLLTEIKKKGKGKVEEKWLKGRALSSMSYKVTRGWRGQWRACHLIVHLQTPMFAQCVTVTNKRLRAIVLAITQSFHFLNLICGCYRYIRAWSWIARGDDHLVQKLCQALDTHLAAGAAPSKFFTSITSRWVWIRRWRVWTNTYKWRSGKYLNRTSDLHSD